MPSSSPLKAPLSCCPASSASSASTPPAELEYQTTLAQVTKSKPPKYKPLKHIERHEKLRYYRPGGFHPVLVGDKLGDSGRFIVVRKLGHGTYGIVWMCWDKEVQRLRAVKIMQADTSEEDFKKEVGLLDLLSKNSNAVSVEEAHKNHLAVPLEHFWQDGPNGRHLCLIMPVLGSTVMKAKILGDVDFLRDVCSQVTGGLAFLHSKGVAHGDLHPGNILFQTTLSDLEREDVEPLLKRNFTYERLFAEGHDGAGPHAPERIYECFDWAKVDARYFKKEVSIIDFGSTFKALNPPNYQTIDVSLRAPELFFGSLPSQASDLWALGCTLMHVLGSSNPFRRNPCMKAWSPVYRWEDALGPLPQPYRARWIASKGPARKRKYEEVDEAQPVSLTGEQLGGAKKRRLEESGTEDVILSFLAKPTIIPVPASERQQRNETENSGDGDGGSDSEESEEWSLPREELESAVDLLRSVFKYKPSDRTPAKDLLTHPFLTKHTPPSPPPPKTRAHSPESTSPAARAAGTP